MWSHARADVTHCHNSSISTLPLCCTAHLPRRSFPPLLYTLSLFLSAATRSSSPNMRAPHHAHLEAQSLADLSSSSVASIVRLTLQQATERELTEVFCRLPALVHVAVERVTAKKCGKSSIDFWNRWPASLTSTLPNVRSIRFGDAPSLEGLCSNTFQLAFPNLETLQLGHQVQAMCVSLSHLGGLKALHTLHIDGPVHDLVFHVEEDGEHRRTKVFDYGAVFPSLRSLAITFDTIDREMVHVCSNLALRVCSLAPSGLVEDDGYDPRDLVSKVGADGQTQPTTLWHSVEEWTINCVHLTTLADSIVSAPRLRSLALREVHSLPTSELNKISRTCAPRLERFRMECLLGFAAVHDAVQAIVQNARRLYAIHLSFQCHEQDELDNRADASSTLVMQVMDVFERVTVPRTELAEVTLEDEHGRQLLSPELKRQLIARHAASPTRL